MYVPTHRNTIKLKTFHPYNVFRRYGNVKLRVVNGWILGYCLMVELAVHSVTKAVSMSSFMNILEPIFDLVSRSNAGV